MTNEAWKKQTWGAGMVAKVIETGLEYPVSAVDFGDGHVELSVDGVGGHWCHHREIEITGQGVPVPSS